MRFENYLNEKYILSEGMLFQKILKRIGNKSAEVVKKILRDNWIKLSSIIINKGLESNVLTIINKHLGTRFKNLEEIDKAVIKEDVNEDFKHYWKLIKDEGFPTLAFYPMLTVWLEIDKLVKGSGDASLKAIIIYGLIWVFLVSGKHIKGWMDWKKSSPEEHEKEGRKKNPFAL